MQLDPSRVQLSEETMRMIRAWRRQGDIPKEGETLDEFNRRKAQFIPRTTPNPKPTDLIAWSGDPDWDEAHQKEIRALIAENDRLKGIAARESKYSVEDLAYMRMFVDGDTYRSVCWPRASWLVDELLPLGYLVVLGASSKAGKTCFATALAHAVAE